MRIDRPTSTIHAPPGQLTIDVWALGYQLLDDLRRLRSRSCLGFGGAFKENDEEVGTGGRWKTSPRKPAPASCLHCDPADLPIDSASPSNENNNNNNKGEGREGNGEKGGIQYMIYASLFWQNVIAWRVPLELLHMWGYVCVCVCICVHAQEPRFLLPLLVPLVLLLATSLTAQASWMYVVRSKTNTANQSIDQTGSECCCHLVSIYIAAMLVLRPFRSTPPSLRDIPSRPV